MSDIHRFSPEERDWFCRGILAEMATYLHVIERGTKTAAAETFGITVPGVIERLRRLEELLAKYLNGGTLLTQAGKNRLEPTEAGRMVADFATAVMAMGEKLLDKLSDTQSRNSISIFADVSVWLAYGPTIEASFKAHVPDGSIQVSEVVRNTDVDDLAYNVAREVHSGRYDIGLTAFPIDVPPPYICRRLVDSEFALVFNRNYRYLPKKGISVNLLDLFRADSKLRFAILSRSEAGPLSNCVYGYIRKMRIPILQYQLIEENGIIDLKRSIGRSANTMSILPVYCIATSFFTADEDLIAYPLDPALKPWSCWLIYRPDSSRSAVQRFIQSVDHLFKKSRARVSRKKS